MNMNPQKLHEELLSKIVPAGRYTGGNAEAWQKEARKKLSLLLGLPEKNCADDLIIEWTKERDGYSETRFTFESEKGFRALAHLLLPAGVQKPETVICLQGHSTGMHISIGIPKYEGDETSIQGGRDFALQAVKNGYAAVALEQRAFGECGGTEKGPACALPAYTALMLGRTLLGERVYDVMRLIDVLESHFADSVNTQKICLTGNSGGGTTTIYAAALDERISVSAPSCAFSAYLESIGMQHHCPCNYVPGISRVFDMADLAALAAPRPQIVMNGKYDGIFPYDKAAEQVEIARKVYEELGAGSNIEHYVGEEGHRYYPNIAWSAINRYMRG